MAKTRVLVTGLSGVVGQAMQRQLAERYELSALSRYGTPGLDEEHDFRGNIADIDSLLPAFKDQDVVVHLAADRSMKAPFESTVSYNVQGLYNVYQAALRCGVRRIVFGSSQHTVGGFYRDPPYCDIFAGRVRARAASLPVAGRDRADPPLRLLRHVQGLRRGDGPLLL